jgi:hypothetical protein
MNENWLEVFDAYGVQFLVLGSQADSDLVDLFRSRPDWKVDFEDGEAIIFARVAAAWGHGNPIHAEGDTREDQMV